MDKNRLTDLVAYWTFDEGSGKIARDDVCGVSDPIEYVFNKASFTKSSDPQWRTGVKGSALLFDGYSTWITRKADEFIQPTGAFTISAWVAPRSYEWGDENRLSAIVNQHNREEKEGFILGMYRHGTWSLQLGLGGKWEEIWSEDAVLEKETWSFIAATFDKEQGVMKLYLNGKEIASKVTEKHIGITPANADLLIGKNNQSSVLAGKFLLNMFNGLMDDVKIYNRSLSGKEIASMFDTDLEPHEGKVPEISYDEIKLSRSVLIDDRHRPQYHASPPAHWMNEPHAPIYYNNQYHLFYQHNPQGPYWHQIHWGHWVSDDMVHWRDLPVALAPERNEVDPDGVWSGSACYDQDGIPALFFTAGDNSKVPDQSVALAKSTFLKDGNNDLVNWEKHPKPLIVQEKGDGLLFGDFRDPFVWKEDDIYYALVGSGLEDKGGTAVAYTSTNMLDWEYKGPFYQTDMEKYPYLGPIWELPVVLPLGTNKEGIEKHIFLISPVGHGADVEVFYWIGELNRESVKFIPDFEEPQLIDVGDFHFTGPSGMNDPKTGRNIIFTIAQGERTPELDYISGWAHNAGLPLSIYLREDGRLGIEPIEELQSLRLKKLASIENKLMEEANESLKDIKGDMLEILVEFEAISAEQVGIKVRRSQEGEEETLIYYDYANSKFKVDRTKTTLSPLERSKGIQGGTLELDDENVILHIYLDRSMIEAYANGLKSLTTRAYPSREDALGLQIWGNGTLNVKSMEVWEMDSIYQSKVKLKEEN